MILTYWMYINGEIPLHDASRNGHLSITEYLVDVCQCDPLHRDSNGVTPLHVAAAEGQIEIVRYFISTKNRDPRVKTSENCTPLDLAAGNGHEVTYSKVLTRLLPL